MRLLYKLLAVTYIAAALILAGCDSSPGGADPNTLYSALQAKVRGLDPGDVGDTTSSMVASQIYECLYQYHFLKRPYEIISQLADDMPQISEDGLTYTIKIKKGVYFADNPCFADGRGRELKAGDFIFAWKRIADIKNLSRNWWIFDNKIVGLDEFREYTKTCKTAAEVDYSRAVGGLQTPDDYTLVIRLKKPWPQIVYLLAHLPTAPMAAEAVEYYGKNITNNPVGTGPFVLKTWRKGSFLELARNPRFRDEFYPSQGEPNDLADGFLADAGRKLPLIDRILFTTIQEDPPLWFLFMQGKLDASGIPKDNFNEAIAPGRKLTEKMQKLNITLEMFRDPSTYWIGFNMEDPVIGGNKPLRKAISRAVNRERYIELFTNGRGEAAYGFVPPLMKEYDPNISSKVDVGFDIRKAKELVAEAEKIYGGKLPELTLAVPGTDTMFRQIGQFFRMSLADAGIKLNVEYMDWPTFQEKVHSKSVQLFSLGWVADYPDAESFLQLFYSKNISPGSNNFNYSNPEFDKIYEKVAVMTDSDERTELYRQAERMVVEDCPAVFLLHGVAFVLHHDWVYNYKPNAFAYGLAKYRRIDGRKRAEYNQLLRTVK